MNKPQKRGKKYRIRWYDYTGMRRSKTFDTYRAAERALTKLQAESQEIQTGVRPVPVPDYTFDQLCDYWVEHRSSRKKSGKDDISIFRRHLRPAFGHLLLRNLTLEKVDDFRRMLCPDERDRPDLDRKRLPKGQVTVKTLHNILTLLISTLNLAMDLRWIPAKPNIKKPKLLPAQFSYIRTREEITDFLSAALEEDAGVYELYSLAVLTGMRAGEILGLYWNAVDLAGRLITVCRSYNNTTKTDEIRYVPILDPLLPLLKKWKVRCPSNLIVFPSQTGTVQQPSARVLQETLQRVRERAEIPYRFSFHSLRHTFASHFMMNGGDIYRLQRILGHKSILMTERYSHLSPTAFASDYGIMGQEPLEKKKPTATVSQLHPGGAPNAN